MAKNYYIAQNPFVIDFANTCVVLKKLNEDKKRLYTLNKKGTKTLVINKGNLF